MDRGTRRHRSPRGERRAHSEDQFIQVRGPRGLPEPRAVLRGRPARPAGHRLAQGSIGANETPLITLLGLLRKKKKWRESGPPSEFFFPGEIRIVKTFVPVKHCSRGTLALNLTHYQRRLDVWKIPVDRRHAQASAADTPSLIIANKMEKRSEGTRFCVFL